MHLLKKVRVCAGVLACARVSVSMSVSVCAEGATTPGAQGMIGLDMYAPDHRPSPSGGDHTAGRAAGIEASELSHQPH